jgi:membrane protein implicated in regulation of membrane protease activity
MLPGGIKIIVGLIATGGMILFITGLAYSISTGFAGFWGGLPFWVISVSVLLMAAYNFWEECLRKK